MERGIFVERAMNSRLIIIGGILAKDPAQVRLPKDDHVVETFPSDRADQSLRIRILPRRTWGNGLVTNTHGSQSAGDCSTVDPVLVADQVAWALISRECSSNLLRDPLSRRVRRHPGLRETSTMGILRLMHIQLDRALAVCLTAPM